MESVSGRVNRVLRSPRDEVDGFLLEGGREIHFPPRENPGLAKAVREGDEITVWGNEETRPRGEIVFEANRIENRGESYTVERPRPPRGPKGGPREARNETPMSARGKVQELVTNKHGDVDGLRLQDGTEVKLPPHQGQDLKALVREGDEVQVDGRRHETPRGDVHLHADRITNVKSGKSIERDDPRGPRPVPPHEREAASAPGSVQGQLDEIRNELRELRKLLEADRKR